MRSFNIFLLASSKNVTSAVSTSTSISPMFSTACRSLRLVNDFIKKYCSIHNKKFISVSNKLFCCHGGLSPDVNLDAIRRIQRPCPVPKTSLIFDILWNDPANPDKPGGTGNKEEPPADLSAKT